MWAFWHCHSIESDGPVTRSKDKNMSTQLNAENITQTAARQIARLALDGDTRYSHEAIGADDGDINAMQTEAGGRQIIRATNDSEVAVYERADGALVIVADANGPIAITIR